MQAEYGVGEQQLTGPMKLTWRGGQSPPEWMGSINGAAVVHGSTAYFSSGRIVYSYRLSESKWTKLPQCKYDDFTMAVINDALTTIGGGNQQVAATNTLLSLCRSSWKEVLPPMPTKRRLPAAANTPTHLVVAGETLSGGIATVEILNTETLQWSTASSLPEAVLFPQMTTCGGCLYIADDKGSIFSCSMEDLLESTNSSDGGSVWTRLASIPVEEDSTLATLRGHVLAVGGHISGTATGDIHCYDVATDSWSVIGEMPTPRFRVLTAVLPSNELVVVGGCILGHYRCSITEIGRNTH